VYDGSRTTMTVKIRRALAKMGGALNVYGSAARREFTVAQNERSMTPCEKSKSMTMRGDGKRGFGHRSQATAPILDST